MGDDKKSKNRSTRNPRKPQRRTASSRPTPTLRRHIEESRRTEVTLRQLVDNIPQVFWMADPEISEMIYISPAYEKIWGRTCESVYKNPLSWLDGIHPDDRERIRDAIGDPRRPRYTQVFRVVRPDGAERTARVRVFPVRDEQGQLYRLAGIVEDITEQKRTDERIRLLLSAVEQSTEGIAVADIDGNILYVNNAFAAMHGYSPDDLLGAHVSIFYTPAQTPAVEAAARRLLEEGRFVGELWLVKRDGTEFLGSMHNALIRNEHSKPIAVVATLRDVTSAKRAEQDLLAAKESLHELVFRSPAVIYRSQASPPFGGLFVSENASSVLGHDPEEFTANPNFWADHIHPEDQTRVLSELQQVFETGYYVCEYRFLHKDGRSHWLHDELRLIRDAAGNPLHIIGYCLDITARKESEEALHASEEKYRTLVDQSIQGIAVGQGLPPRLVFVNPSLARMGGYTVEELLSLSPERTEGLVHPEDRGMFFGRFAKRLAGETVPPHYQVRILRKDGTTRWTEVSSTRIQYRGQPAVQAVFIDITDRKQAEDALRKSEALYHTTIDGLDDIIHVVDSDLRMILTNTASRQWINRLCPGKDPIGCNLSQVFSFLSDRVTREYEQVFREGKTLVTEEVTTIGGKQYVTETRKIPLFEGGKVTRVVTVVHDITRRKQMEESLRESEEQYRNLFESIGDGIIVSGPEGQILAANPAAARMVRCASAEELSRMKSTDFYAQPKQRERLFAQLRERGSISNVEMTAQRMDGSTGIFSGTFTAHFDEERNITQVDGIFRDLTEKRKMEEELLNARRIESLGVLAAGIAHDFNNILTAATANLFLSRAHAGGDSELLEHLAGAEKAISLAKRLTHQLLTFSKGGAPIVQTASLTEILKDSVDLALSGSNVRCELSLPKTLWPVRVDVGQISQVINNLVLNAVQAMPEGGVIRVCADNLALQDSRPAPLQEGGYVKVSIQDTGIGIPKEHFSKIFDPYFTTKPGGSGLGLATAYTIVRRHAGHIAFESEPGIGSAFSVYLPASEDPLPETAEYRAQASCQATTGERSILLMDDEEQVREATSEVLKELGYRVDAVNEGALAVQKYAAARKSGRPYDAVILDLTVAGGMGGKEAILRLLEMDPDVKALCASGYANDPIMADYESYGFKGILTKPYRGEELAEKLHRVLKRSGR
jgi:PAS domain S-box-containing protein